MMRVYIPVLAAFVIGLASCKDVEQPFSFNPMPDSIYRFSLDIVDSGGMPDNASRDSLEFEFTLQRTGQRDSLVIMNLGFERLSITQPGIQLTSMENGSITVLPAGTTVTVSTEEVDTTAIYEDLFNEYYSNWKAILPKLRGDSLQLTINSSGEVMRVTGFDRIAERIAAESGIDIRTVRQYLRDYAGNESIRDLVGHLFFFLPGKKIHKGDQWVKNVTTTAYAPVKMSYLVTAIDVDEKNNDIAVNVQSVVSAKTAEEGRRYAEGEMSGTIAATYDSGMPYLIRLTQLVTTHTDQYDVVSKRTIRLPRH